MITTLSVRRKHLVNCRDAGFYDYVFVNQTNEPLNFTFNVFLEMLEFFPAIKILLVISVGLHS